MTLEISRTLFLSAIFLEAKAYWMNARSIKKTMKIFENNIYNMYVLISLS